MKTSVDIPDEMLNELLRNTDSHTKREAILRAISEFNRRRKVAALADVIGTCEDIMDSHELADLRESD